MKIFILTHLILLLRHWHGDINCIMKDYTNCTLH